MKPEQAAALRAAFKSEQIGKLPKPYKKDSPKGDCKVCGGYHGLPAAHLDYVGHAATTDRLLQVDPLWTWEPVAFNADGLPKLDDKGGLWIKLTICGVTRYGYGDSLMGHGVKELIGDAIRNAAMRFGVALDLWSKEDLANSGKEIDGDKGAGTDKKTPQKDSEKVDEKALLPLVDECNTVEALTALWKSFNPAQKLAMKDALSMRKSEITNAGA